MSALLTSSSTLMAGTLLGVVGLVLLKLGLWSRRRGKTPYCRKCEYNLTGSTGQICPECGSSLNLEGVVLGERHRRPAATAIGVLAVGLAIAYLGWVAWQYDWYQAKPAGWLISDLESGKLPVAQRAWTELMRRDRTGGLSEAKRSALIDVCIRTQLAGRQNPLSVAHLNHLGDCLLQGRMSKEQEATFLEQMVTLDFEVRRRVVCGDSVPYEFPSTIIQGPSRSLGFWINLPESPLLLDGKPIASKTRAETRGTDDWFWGERRALRPWMRLKIDPGRHTLGFVQKVIFFQGPLGDPAASHLHYTKEFRLQKEFEALAAEPPDLFREIDDPAVREALLERIQLTGFKYYPEHSGVIRGSISIHDLPVNVAFEVLLRSDGKEGKLGAITGRAHAAKQGSGIEAGWEGGPLAKGDIILRSSKRIAKDETVDLYEYWKGELVFKDVAIK